MLNTGQFEVRVDRVHRRYIFCSGVMYLAGFLISIIVGVSGPSVWKASNGDSTNDCPTHDCALDVFGRMDNATWSGELTSMGAEHQLLYLEGSIAKPSFNADEHAAQVRTAASLHAIAGLSVWFTLLLASFGSGYGD